MRSSTNVPQISFTEFSRPTTIKYTSNTFFYSEHHLSGTFQWNLTGVTSNDNSPRLTSSGKVTSVYLLIRGLFLDPTTISSVATPPVAICPLNTTSPNNSATESPPKSTRLLTSTSRTDCNFSAQSSLTLISSSLSLVHAPTTTAPLATTYGRSICIVERTPWATVIVFTG